MWARYSFNAFTIYQSVAIWSVCAVASYRKAFTQTDRIFGVVFGDANSHLTVNKVHRCRCTHSAPNRIKSQQQQQNWFRCSRVCQMWPTMSKTFLFFVLFNIRHEIKKIKCVWLIPTINLLLSHLQPSFVRFSMSVRCNCAPLFRAFCTISALKKGSIEINLK